MVKHPTEEEDVTVQSTNRVGGPRRPISRTVKKPEVRREEITDAARSLFMEQGIGRTTLKDVAARVGVARGLIYYYFPDKDALVDVVLNEYIDEFVEAVRVWDAAREPGNIERALTDCIAIFRAHVHTPDPLREDLHRVENAGLYARFVDRAVRAIVDCFQLTAVSAYAARHQIQVDHVYETFYVLVYGLIGLVRNTPEIADDVLVTIVRQALYLRGGAPDQATP